MKYDNTDIHLHYDQARKISEERMALWFTAISKYISGQPIKIIVDLGCGTGRFLKALANHFSAEVFGIDPSWNMLTVAQTTSESTRIPLIQGVGEYIPLGNDFASLVFLSQTYHHIQNKHRALAEIRRILQPNGFLCIRNSTRECLDTYLHLRFFPEALKSDRELLPSRYEITNQLQKTKFELKGHDVVNQKFAENANEYLSKIKLKTDSDLAQLSDEAFQKGLTRLEMHFKTHNINKPIFEDLDLFIFKKL